MNPKRFFYVMVGLVSLLSIGFIGATYLANNMLKSKASELTELKLQNKVIEIQQTSVGQAKKDIEKYSELEGIARSVVPQEKDQAKTVREIIKIAEDSGISISSITFPASNLGQKSATNTNNSTPTTPSIPLSQVKAVSGITGVYQLDITIQTPANSSITYTQLINFLNRLEQNRRTSQVSNIAIRPTATSRQSARLSFTLGLTVYIKP
jgi:hypothetical protein